MEIEPARGGKKADIVCVKQGALGIDCPLSRAWSCTCHHSHHKKTPEPQAMADLHCYLSPSSMVRLRDCLW